MNRYTWIHFFLLIVYTCKYGDGIAWMISLNSKKSFTLSRVSVDFEFPTAMQSESLPCAHKVLKVGNNDCGLIYTDGKHGHADAIYFNPTKPREFYDIIGASIKRMDIAWSQKIELGQYNSIQTAFKYSIRGCRENTFGLQCLSTCGHCLHKSPCEEITGNCSLGCEAGWQPNMCNKVCSFGKFGENCAKSCNCLGKDGCDRKTGYCKGRKCKIGHTGRTCQTCYPSFFGWNCKERCHCYLRHPCNPATGYCGKHGCSMGYVGKNCSIRHVCPMGQFGRNCKECGRCKAKCILSRCYTECNSDTGACLNRCEKNFAGALCMTCVRSKYGRNCQYSCGHCLSKTCDPVTGHCDFQGCQDGYVGVKCDIECSNGFYGNECAHKCPVNCIGDCDFKYGTCSACKPGFNGSQCEFAIGCTTTKTWGANCQHLCGNCLHHLPCDRQNGNCPFGCAAGYFGPLCTSSCPDGRYGVNCAEHCGACKDWKLCDKFTGKCPDGCVGKFIKPLCVECPPGWFGHECLERCGHCRNKARCHVVSGACEEGCSKGFTGYYCTERHDSESTLHNLEASDWP